MPSSFPEGVEAPEHGLLPTEAASSSSESLFSVYLHVPFCRVRCGYCDFNTYTATELKGVSQLTFADEALREVRFAGQVLEQSGVAERPVSTVFFGGGTPTLLPAADLVRMLAGIREEWGLADNAEITTEANPDSVDERALETLREGGFTRLSIGMQSAVPHVLRTLDRTHDPDAVPRVVDIAKQLGFQVSLDLIYGTPGESLSDWGTSLSRALESEPDHLSAYALIVEDGTKLARQIKRGEVAAPNDDLHAEMYELADEQLRGHGLDWYEISNWARSAEHRSRHNLAYWTGQDWWAIGPGAHSHIGGVRWWNVKHPAAYAERMSRGVSPALQRELLSEEDRRIERIMLEARVRHGVPTSLLSDEARRAVAALIAEGLVDGAEAIRGRIVPTLAGRLLSDTLVHRLLQ